MDSTAEAKDTPQTNGEKMREHELDYLRSELNQRVNFTCEHMHKVFGHIMLLWGGANIFGFLLSLFVLLSLLLLLWV